VNVFYEEEGTLKVGAILADNTTSLQVEAPHGKRSKIKSSAVLLRFDAPALSDFLPQAQQVAGDIDIDFLWECSAGEEFDHETLAREYFGRPPAAVEAAGVMMALHGAPMYFYKRGRGRYKAAPEEALKAALASVERKRQQALKKDAYMEQLARDELPEDLGRSLATLLYRPDRTSIEWKALEEASAAAKTTPVRLIARCGGIPSTHDYHLNRFLFEHFPRGADFAEFEADAPPADLPLSGAVAFSIDDASTTEIDDAFSVTVLPNGNTRFGIHIAAPALGIAPDSALDTAARERLSTVYFPGGKITMLPESAIEHYTLAADRTCPALSMYVELDSALAHVATETRVDRVFIAENLRHDTLEPLFNDTALASGTIEHPRGTELKKLWDWARVLEKARRGDAPETTDRADYSFQVENDRVAITRRMRGTPIDKVVSELMIHVNSTWGRQLAQTSTRAIYRVQGGGKVRMSTVPAAHVGLGVEQYVWSSSPLRRYVDLANQRQIAALARGEPAPYQENSDTLLAVMREFESAYDVYAEFQRSMERYWCLRWLLQENVESVVATVLRENLCRFDELPLVARVASLPAFKAGSRVELDVSSIDLLELSLHCEFRRECEVPDAAAVSTDSDAETEAPPVYSA
jgi:exoribonuclease II